MGLYNIHDCWSPRTNSEMVHWVSNWLCCRRTGCFTEILHDGSGIRSVSQQFVWSRKFSIENIYTTPAIDGRKTNITYGSLYILFGQSAATTVEGYNGLAGIDVHYSIFQGTLGYQFTFPNTHFKLGIGPSLFVFNYNLTNYFPAPPSNAPQYSPGMSLMLRAPFGKEVKLFGVEFFFAMNVAKSVHINDICENVNYEENQFTGGKLSMVYGMIGLNFVLRK